VHALRHRLHISLLERLMDLPLYTVPYNPACITKLVRNFRSHEKVSSPQFSPGGYKEMSIFADQ
jgi:hypothetical protein